MAAFLGKLAFWGKVVFLSKIAFLKSCLWNKVCFFKTKKLIILKKPMIRFPPKKWPLFQKTLTFSFLSLFLEKNNTYNLTNPINARLPMLDYMFIIQNEYLGTIFLYVIHSIMLVWWFEIVLISNTITCSSFLWPSWTAYIEMSHRKILKGSWPLRPSAIILIAYMWTPLLNAKTNLNQKGELISSKQKTG